MNIVGQTTATCAKNFGKALQHPESAMLIRGYLVVLVFALVFAIVPSVLTGAPTGYEIGMPEAQATEISACGILNTSNTVYTLTRNLNESDINATGCFNITAQNITLDCQNFFIRNLTLAVPGIYSNQINTTIMNCNVTMSSASGGYGIHFVSANNSFIYNSILNSQFFGIYLQKTSNVSIDNITANSNMQGIFLTSSSNNNQLTNITANSNAYGIHLSSSSNSNTIVNIRAVNSSSRGVYFESSSINILTGITVTSSTDSGIVLESNSNNNIFTNITANSNNGAGIYLSSSSNNQLVNITATANSYYGNGGIHLSSNSHNNTIANVISNLNYYGIYLSSSSNNILTNITANSNTNTGIYLSSSSNNTISASSFSRSRGTVFVNTYTNNFTSTQFLANIIPSSNFSTNSQEGTTGNRIDFNITMNHINGSACPSCSYKLDLYPAETSFANSSSSQLIIGNFTPTKIGIYSLKINITDNNNNSEIRKYIYWINITATDLVNYYFRGIWPTHGQTESYGSTTDGGSLLFEKPSSAENRTCGTHIGFSPDILPDYLFGIYKQINYSIWYQTSVIATNWTGVERYGEGSWAIDYNTTVSATTKSFGTFNFSVNWTNDYLWIWYWIAIKLRGGNPYIYSNSTDPSYANITYSYPNTPAIKSLSNEDIDVLSATMDSNTSTSANITLDGTGNVTVVIQMPLTEPTYSVLYDGIACVSNDNCMENSNSNGLINLTLVTSAEHNVSIITDTAAPSITAHNISVTYPTNVSVLFSFTDNYRTDTFSINDTLHFEMNKTGSLINISYLNVAQHWLNITANDTYNNTASVVIWANVSTTTTTTINVAPDRRLTTTTVNTTLTTTINATISSTTSILSTINGSTTTETTIEGGEDGGSPLPIIVVLIIIGGILFMLGVKHGWKW